MTVTSHDNIMASLNAEKMMSKGAVNVAFVNDEKTPGNGHVPPLNGTDKTTAAATGQTAEKGATMDFDDLLPHVGEFGRYQQMLFLLMIPFAFFVAFVYFSQIFITLVPEEHWCNVPELSHLPVEQR